MSQGLAELGAAMRATAAEGVGPGPVESTWCVRQSSPTPLENRRWRASLAFVAEGEKELRLGGRCHRLVPGTYTLTLVPLPVVSRFVGPTTRDPFLAMLIGVDANSLARVAAAMDPIGDPAPPGRALFVDSINPAMSRALARLASLFSCAEAARVLGAGVHQELLYAALCGPHGPAIRRFVEADGAAFSVARAVHRIEAHLADDLDVGALARSVGLGRTAFFEAFRAVTSVTPVQYRRRLRLLEAQRLMVYEQASAETACYRVGYRSPSHFSREYTRLFGAPPAAHARCLRAQHAGGS